MKYMMRGIESYKILKYSMKSFCKNKANVMPSPAKQNVQQNNQTYALNDDTIMLSEKDKKYFKKSEDEYVHVNKANTTFVLNKLFKKDKKKLEEIDDLYKSMELDGDEDDVEIPKIQHNVDKVHDKFLTNEPTYTDLRTPKFISNSLRAKEKQIDTQHMKNKDEEAVGFDIVKHLESIRIKQNTDNSTSKAIFFTNSLDNSSVVLNNNHPLKRKLEFIGGSVNIDKVLAEHSITKDKNKMNYNICGQNIFAYEKAKLDTILSKIKATNPKILTIIVNVSKDSEKNTIGTTFIIGGSEHIATIAINYGGSKVLIVKAFQAFYVLYLADLFSQNFKKAKFKLISVPKGMFDSVQFKSTFNIMIACFNALAKNYIKNINNKNANDIESTLTTYNIRAKVSDFNKTMKTLGNLKESEVLYNL
jgi:hypothetical protein